MSRETYSRNPINYSEGMANDQKDRFIQYLTEQHQESGEPIAERFPNLFKRFFSKKYIYDEAGFTPKERLRERQSLKTKVLLMKCAAC